MPFGEKKDNSGNIIDFDKIYSDFIKPSIVDAELDPIRADEEKTGGFIHKPMYERLILCDYAIADLTTANANVFYELGVRHAVKPYTTILLFNEGSRLPFDIAPLRAFPYTLNTGGNIENLIETKRKLSDLLISARSKKTDSPIFQLLEDYPDIDHSKTDVFRELVNYSNQMKTRIADARNKDLKSLLEIEKELKDLNQIEAGVIIDLFLSYRAIKAWNEMVILVEKMPLPLSSTVLVREQYAFALNRLEKSEEAERVITELIKEKGKSSESFGILGRIYKDRWEIAYQDGKNILAKGLIEKAIEAYLKGFEADWRDAYPGINAVTLMFINDPEDMRIHEILSVVNYSVNRRIVSGNPDYWDHATILELAVIENNELRAFEALSKASVLVREVWEPETTIRNLKLIDESRVRNNLKLTWPKNIENELKKLIK